MRYSITIMEKENLNLKEIGSRLKEAREAVSKNLQDMAGTYDSTIKSIVDMEKGQKTPQADYLTLLHSQFNVNLNWLFSGTGAMFADLEIKADFGQDNELIKEIIYVMEYAPVIRYNIFTHYLKAKHSDSEYVKEILAKRDSGDN